MDQPQAHKHVVLLCLTDDPMDPAGTHGHGGSHVFAFDLGRHLVRAGCSVHYLVRMDSDAKKPDEQLGSHCRITRITAGPRQEVLYHDCAEYIDELHDECRSLIASRQVPSTILHSYNWVSGEVGRRLAREFGLPHVHSVLALGRARCLEGEQDKVSDQWLQAEMRIFESASHITVFSDHERSELLTLYPEISHERISVIPYCLDVELFYPRPCDRTDHFRRAADRFAQGIDSIP